MPLSESDFMVLFPFRYLFPRQLLVKHFWTPKQQIDFLDIYHGLRRRPHSEIITHLRRASTFVSHEKLRWHLTDLCTKVSLHPGLRRSRALKPVRATSLGLSKIYSFLARCRMAPTRQHRTSWLSETASPPIPWASAASRLLKW